MSIGVPRAREELFAAHLLATTGFAAQAVSHAVHAALSAAEAALLLLGRVPPADPAAIVAAFVRHAVRERGLDPEAGRQLRSLLNRGVAASSDGNVPQAEAPVAIADATVVVDIVAAWIDSSNRAGARRPAGTTGQGRDRAGPPATRPR